jgi:hypothetical protein
MILVVFMRFAVVPVGTVILTFPAFTASGPFRFLFQRNILPPKPTPEWPLSNSMKKLVLDDDDTRENYRRIGKKPYPIFPIFSRKSIYIDAVDDRSGRDIYASLKSSNRKFQSGKMSARDRYPTNSPDDNGAGRGFRNGRACRNIGGIRRRDPRLRCLEGENLPLCYRQS